MHTYVIWHMHKCMICSTKFHIISQGVTFYESALGTSPTITSNMMQIEANWLISFPEIIVEL